MIAAGLVAVSLCGGADEPAVPTANPPAVKEEKTAPPPPPAPSAQEPAAKPSGGFTAPRPERIAEIAALLEPQAAGIGRPITDRAAWDRLAKMPEAQDVLSAAALIAAAPPPELPDELYLEFSRTGNRANYQKPYLERLDRLSALLRAECLLDQGKFLGAIEREILAICSERSWVMPAHDPKLENFKGANLYVDLGSSARAWLLATAQWWLQDRLKPETAQRLRAEVNRRVLDPYLKMLRSGKPAGGFWWVTCTNNWNAACNANVMSAALALVESPAQRAEFLAGMEMSNPYFISGFADDGYCTEGMGYWNYGFGHYMFLGETVWAATDGRLNLYQDPKLKRIAAFARDIQIQKGVVPAFADCDVNATADPFILAMIQRRFPETLANPAKISGVLKSSAQMLGLFGFGEQPGSESMPVATPGLGLRNWFDAAGVLIVRLGPGREPPFGAAFKGGHNAEHHNHNDLGSLVVVHDGHSYLLDPGSEVYTRRTFSPQRYESKVLNSYGHPVPVVAGKLQQPGRQAQAKILRSSFADGADRLVLDLSSAYDVPDLRKLVRRFEFDRTRSAITVEDQVEFAQPQSFGTALITLDRVLRRDDHTFVIYDSKASVVADVTVEGGEWEYAEEIIDNPGAKSPTRMGFNLKAPVSAANVRFTLRPAPLAADIPGVYVAPDIGPDFQPQLGQAVQVEAEDVSRQDGGQIQVCDKPGASGKAFKLWDNPGHLLEWTFELPKAGRCAFQVRCCQDSPAPVLRQVRIDGAPLGGPDAELAFPRTGGWSTDRDDWRNVWLALQGKAVTMDLVAGPHTLTFINESGGGLNLDWIRIVPVAP
ncbi:MAG: hypothetical protein A3K19_20075 [Lentisphaerae bacterium RIFOXYB12_FULL_65_16]|nr:MAG: hypothetical protein A3K18_11155 [Lentisphaerae bacterium RIFOXYA12_64_32]OGV91760.1 MAG: hypothetical protein A3K19_20075 [Lentisphaerae bacterium RIFOXYB12_FULL_65_16]